MMFTNTSRPQDVPQVYVSGDYRLEHSKVGFDIDKVTPYFRDEAMTLLPFAGPSALERGMELCRMHARRGST